MKMKKKKKFLWASVHDMTSDQTKELLELGSVVYLKDIDRKLYDEMCNLKFTSVLCDIAYDLGLYMDDGYIVVQPAGSPALQAWIGNVLEGKISGDNDVWYSFSDRVSEDVTLPDGSVKKVSMFRHKGWIKLER